MALTQLWSCKNKDNPEEVEEPRQKKYGFLSDFSKRSYSTSLHYPDNYTREINLCLMEAFLSLVTFCYRNLTSTSTHSRYQYLLAVSVIKHVNNNVILFFFLINLLSVVHLWYCFPIFWLYILSCLFLWAWFCNIILIGSIKSFQSYLWNGSSQFYYCH